MPSMPGQSIPCAQCGERFVFTDAERAFYDGRGLLPPRRCKECRAARKRSTWTATCAACGVPASVPFEPIAGRDVFCAGCWRARHEHAGAADAADADAEREWGMPAIIE